MNMLVQDGSQENSNKPLILKICKREIKGVQKYNVSHITGVNGPAKLSTTQILLTDVVGLDGRPASSAGFKVRVKSMLPNYTGNCSHKGSCHILINCGILPSPNVFRSI
jgi:hypothetical protein